MTLASTDVQFTTPNSPMLAVHNGRAFVAWLIGLILALLRALAPYWRQGLKLVLRLISRIRRLLEELLSEGTANSEESDPHRPNTLLAPHCESEIGAFGSDFHG